MPGGGGGGRFRGFSGGTKKKKLKSQKHFECDNYKSRQFETWKSCRQTKTFHIC